MTVWRYGIKYRTGSDDPNTDGDDGDTWFIGAQEAMIRSGRLGLPWVGHPVAWARPMADDMRIVPIARCITSVLAT